MGLYCPLPYIPTAYACVTEPCYCTAAATGAVYCSMVASIVAGAVVVVKVTAYYCCGYVVAAGKVSTAVL